MVKAYFISFVPNKDITRVLVEIENCEDSVYDFDREVFDKDYAEYTIDKFKIIKIINEFCNEYTTVYIGNLQATLNDIVDKKTTCYLTKKRALNIQTITGRSYYNDGQIKEKKYYDNPNKSCSKSEEFYPNGQMKKLENYKNGFMKSGEYKVWNKEGQLLNHCIYENDKVIKNLFDVYDYFETLIIKELETNATVYNEENKSIFMKNIKELLNEHSVCTGATNKIKYCTLNFKYLNSIVGLTILRTNYKLQKTIIQKIEELKNDKRLKEYLDSDDEKDNKLANELISSMTIIKEKIDLMN